MPNGDIDLTHSVWTYQVNFWNFRHAYSHFVHPVRQSCRFYLRKCIISPQTISGISGRSWQMENHHLGPGSAISDSCQVQAGKIPESLRAYNQPSMSYQLNFQDLVRLTVVCGPLIVLRTLLFYIRWLQILEYQYSILLKKDAKQSKTVDLIRLNLLTIY